MRVKSIIVVFIGAKVKGKTDNFILNGQEGHLRP